MLKRIIVLYLSLFIPVGLFVALYYWLITATPWAWLQIAETCSVPGVFLALVPGQIRLQAFIEERLGL